MFRNYLTVSFRNILRNKAFSAINILGLAIGISSALIIYLIVHYDFNFDRFEPNGDRIYRVVSENSYQGSIGHSRGVPAPLGEVIRKNLTGIEELANFHYYNVQKTIVGTEGKTPFKVQSNVVFADGHYFNVFPYQWLAGSAKNALTEPNRVVLDETRAKLYFPGVSYNDIIGRKITYDDTLTTTVAGIVANLDAQGSTDFKFEEFISLPTLTDNKYLRDQFYWDQWGSTTSDHQVYVMLAPNQKAATIEAGLTPMFRKYFGGDNKPGSFNQTYLLQPLKDIHFNGDYGVFNNSTANKSVLYGLMLVAAFLLLMACINFVNLTTAQATQRAKEIGIRKTMGSSKWQLVIQFLCETFAITTLATVLSLGVTPLLLKAFGDFIPTGLHFSLSEPYLLAFGVVLVIVVSLLAGFYPSLVLSSWRPVKVLKSQAYTGAGKGRMRQTLTVLQFVIAQVFVMATLIVAKQIGYMQNKDLGFRKEAILSFGTPDKDTSFTRRGYFIHEVQQLPGIRQVSLASDVPSSGGTWSSVLKFNDGKKEVETAVEIKSGDTNYLPIFKIPLLAGRQVVPADTIKEVMINEAYLHVLGFQKPQDAIGKTLHWDNKVVPIVGVMKNFYAHSLDDIHLTVKPLLFTEADGNVHGVVVHLQEEKKTWQATINKMEALYKSTYPGEDFHADFFDESLAAAYGSEQRISRLLTWATGITVLISCLGLLGLVIFTTRQRVKEIGVRKVLGASVGNIVSILSTDFIKLVAIAFALATPVAWWTAHRWLANFPERTEISWWVFVLSGLGMVAMAFITLSIQTVRAARANPIKSLRTE